MGKQPRNRLEPKPHRPLPPTALYTRRQAAAVLNSTVSTLCRMEADGVLRPVRLRASKHSPVLYRVEEIERLITPKEK